MSTSRSILVTSPQETDIPAVVDIHQSVLGYTFNSQMGRMHLAAMYRSMLTSPDCCVQVAYEGATPIGLVSGTLDVDRTRREIIKNFALRNWINMLLVLIRKPSLIDEWIKGNAIGKPVHVANRPVTAFLSTIAIRSDRQAMGVGGRLIHALEEFFLQRGVEIYRLDTLCTNNGARSFYARLGFREIEQRADSVVLVKRIAKQ